MDRLKPENCNKAKCKTCMFGPTPIKLTRERMVEITTYLSNFDSSHICHTTDKTCYGGMELQAKLLYRMGLIPEDSVKSFLETANTFLHGNKK